jgi:hypothetical protein
MPNTPISPVQTSSTDTPTDTPSAETLPWCRDVLEAIKRYTGDVNLSTFPSISKRLRDDDYSKTDTKFEVIGLTKDIIIVMDNTDINMIFTLINIDMSPVNNAKSELDAQHIKLALICDALNTWQVLQFGCMLTSQVVPVPLEEPRYTWYIMPKGGAYVWDAWRVLLIRNQPLFPIPTTTHDTLTTHFPHDMLKGSNTD